MRIRSLKPDFWKHQVMCEQAPEVRLLAIGLLNLADDEGYFLAHPSLIRGELMPFAENLKSIPKMLAALESIGYVRLSKTADGRDVGQVVSFHKHQVIQRPKASKLSEPSEIEQCRINDESLTHPVIINDATVQEQGTGNREVEQGTGLKLDPVGSELAAPVPDWSLKSGWKGCGGLVRLEWEQAYPACDINRQLLAMDQWLKSNPLKAKKSNWRKFITTWLQKEQDRGGDLRSSNPSGHSPGLGWQKKELAAAFVEAPAVQGTEAPEGWEAAMDEVFGDGWQDIYACWRLVPHLDQAKVRAVLAKRKGGAEQ